MKEEEKKSICGMKNAQTILRIKREKVKSIQEILFPEVFINEKFYNT
jgi:hypothetical protein